MIEPNERLRQARRAAGYEEATEAARALGLREPTYLAHENGSRGFKARAAEYARKYGVSLEWLLTGRGSRERRENPPTEPGTVRLIGYVGNGAEVRLFGDGRPERVPAPEGATDETVALEIRGENLGSLYDRWLIFYDDVRRPVTPDLVGRLCVAGLDTGQILVKKVQRSRAPGLFHLISQTESPILDVAVDWAARVKSMAPR